MKNRTNKGTGAGGHMTNLNGIKFEEKTYLGNWIISNGYRLEMVDKSTNRTQLFKIFKNKIFIGFYGRQSKIYDALKIMYPNKIDNVRIKEILSKRIFPDAFILNVKKYELVIFEKKWQQSSGSVDEKIQTAPFKLQMFENLTRNIPLNVKYQYILSKWFKNDRYRNVKEYYLNNNKIDIWVYEENLNSFNIKKYLKL